MTARLAPGVAHYVAGAAPWMSWNLVLALVPWLLAVALFDRAVRPRRLWWVGATVCVLLLPNAAYVLTDVVHLPAAVRGESSDAVVLLAVLPMFATLFTIGFLAYVDAVRRLVSWSVASGWVRREWPLALAVHAGCAVGIYAGRIHRLNSWDLVLHPNEVARATLTGFGRPLAMTGMLVTFCVLALGYSATATTLRAIQSSNWS